jgi:PhnB protein
MASLSIVPYIFFKGNAKEAMEFYKNAFGGELTVQTMGEAPKEMQMPGANPSDVMHARLKGPVELMASDSVKASDKMAKVELAINGSSADEAEMRKIFEKLSEGGEVKMALSNMPWGDIYGQITDKFGVDWMMDIGDSMAGDSNA